MADLRWAAASPVMAKQMVLAEKIPTEMIGKMPGKIFWL
jgi:hypothetical protein